MGFIMLEINSPSLKVSGHVKLYSFPADEVPSIEAYRKLKLDKSYMKKHLVNEGKNLVVATGVHILLNLISKADSVGISHMEAGTGSTAIVAGTSALETPLSPRVEITDSYRVANTVYFEAFFAKNDANGAWTEVAMHNAVSGGAMAAASIVGSFTKSTSNVTIILWGITLTAS